MKWLRGRARTATTTVAALVLVGCAGQGRLATRRSPVSDPHQQLAALEHRIFVLVEKERLATNPSAKPLALDPELTAVARTHSEDMAREHFLGHRAPDGETTAKLMMARDKSFQGLLGENIAAQYYTKDIGINVNAYASRFVKTWMLSKSHRDNLTFSDYSKTGVGAAINGHEVFVTQLFADVIPQHRNVAKDAHREVARYTDPTVAMQARPFARPKLPAERAAAPKVSTP